MTQGLPSEEITRSVIGAFYEVYNELGFGMLEHIYVLALERELVARGHHVARELGVVIHYKGVEIGRQRLDMVVGQQVVVEVKAAQQLHPSAARQLLSYLRASTLEVGLLLHFGTEPTFKRLYAANATKPHAVVPSRAMIHVSRPSGEEVIQ